MGPVDRVIYGLCAALMATGAALVLLSHMGAFELPKAPYDPPLWCHNWQHEELSGVCSTVKGLEWSI